MSIILEEKKLCEIRRRVFKIFRSVPGSTKLNKEQNENVEKWVIVWPPLIGQDLL